MELSDRLGKQRIVLAANIVDGYPSEFEYTRDFLLRNGATRLFTISSPLQKRSKGRTVLCSYKNGKLVRELSMPRPNFPPFTYVLDLLLVLLRKRYDLWIGFNPFMTAIGVMSSNKGTVVNWGIDFVPHRGEGGLAETGYRLLERLMMKRIKVQVENTLAARDARVLAHNITPPLQLLAPIGVWSSDFSQPTLDRHLNRKVVYFGSIDERNGASFLVKVLRMLVLGDNRVTVEIIGAGECAHLFTSLEREFPQQVLFHGYKESQAEVNNILRKCTIALAPFEESSELFTTFADPQKLKYYASNGLPVILTDVATPAKAMSEVGAAIVLSHNNPPQEWVTAITEFLDDENYWSSAAHAAYSYSLRFDRELIYTNTFSEIFNVLD